MTNVTDKNISNNFKLANFKFNQKVSITLSLIDRSRVIFENGSEFKKDFIPLLKKITIEPKSGCQQYDQY